MKIKVIDKNQDKIKEIFMLIINNNLMIKCMRFKYKNQISIISLKQFERHSREEAQERIARTKA